MQVITLPADRTYNPPLTAVFPPGFLKPIAPVDDSELEFRVGWSKALEPYRAAKVIEIAQRCRSQFIEQDITTPYNKYFGALNPLWCEREFDCAHCCTSRAEKKRREWTDYGSAVLRAGHSITAFSFVFSLPGWSAQLGVQGCPNSQTFGRMCPTGRPCAACTVAREADLRARAEETAVWDGIDAAIDSHIPAHGGWWHRRLEQGSNGELAIRFTVLFVDAMVGSGTIATSDPGAAFGAVQEAYRAALEPLGGIDGGSGCQSWDQETGGELAAFLGALLKPEAMRLQAWIDNADSAPVLETVTRWIRGAELCTESKAGKMRRIANSGIWGKLSSGCQHKTLTLLRIAKQNAEQVPTERVIKDKLRTVERSGSMMRLQSEVTGKERAVLASITHQPGVDARGLPLERKLPKWVPFDEMERHSENALSACNDSRLIASIAEVSGSETSQISGPQPEPIIVLDDIGRQTVFESLSETLEMATSWSHLPVQITALASWATPDALPKGFFAGWRSFSKPVNAPVSADLVGALAQAACSGYQVTVSVNDSADVRISGTTVRQNPHALPLSWDRVRIDADLQKTGKSVDELVSGLSALGVPINAITASGSGGAHVDILLTPDPTGAEYQFRRVTARRLHKYLAPFGVDMSTATINHAFKPAGALSWKGDAPRMARSVFRSAAPAYITAQALNTALDAAGAKPLENGWHSDGTFEPPVQREARINIPAPDADMDTLLNAAPAWIERRLEDGPEDCNQSNTTIAMVRNFGELGASAEQILEIFEEYGVDRWRHWNRGVAPARGQRLETLDIAWIDSILDRYGS